MRKPSKSFLSLDVVVEEGSGPCGPAITGHCHNALLNFLLDVPTFTRELSTFLRWRLNDELPHLPNTFELINTGSSLNLREEGSWFSTMAFSAVSAFGKIEGSTLIRKQQKRNGKDPEKENVSADASTEPDTDDASEFLGVEPISLDVFRNVLEAAGEIKVFCARVDMSTLPNAGADDVKAAADALAEIL
ncbi:hypothetical protein B0H14DRAFT_3453967 [Mycena olivaceomarginata]|nr:hypothetical protein B0H14DRAFT_3453967 [Mycena olivaceomarginata]